MAAESRPPFPSFSLQRAIQRARLGYGLDRRRRSCAELLLDRKWKRELDDRPDHPSRSALGR
ncbi:hypothetical protein AKJ09_06241 [Labilithrix luteola]|uniref:Uncharacterized protein n=1 Tax=Labilithrix luteola TaxID=1391654 RepID=A0A0K1Q1G4_9BACT|nr:hypothetical protein AKJ09_06241 [Labilithrix luteola]